MPCGPAENQVPSPREVTASAVYWWEQHAPACGAAWRAHCLQAVGEGEPVVWGPLARVSVWRRKQPVGKALVSQEARLVK
jgi:hypothetical protein